MRVLITGAAGLFGQALTQVFVANHIVFPVTHAVADTTDTTAIRDLFVKLEPEIVIHAAAIPDLDICEADPALALSVNVEGTRNVVEAARGIGAAVAFISSDSVFDGKKTTPYIETDAANPGTVYGRTKVQGEEIVRTLPAHWIFRVPVLFGFGKVKFVEKAFIKLMKGEEFFAASDQVASAAYTLDAAHTMMEVIEARRHGLFHVANAGQCSRYQLARRAAEIAGLNSTLVVGRPLAEMGGRAKRLKYSVMEMRALKENGFAAPRSWEEALQEYVHLWQTKPKWPIKWQRQFPK
jgi:dTDP-4-dehydrorhamnose reductase